MERIDRRTADRMLRGLNRYTIAAMCSKCDRCNRPVPTTTAAPWLNDDLSRPVTDIKELDYNRRLIIYRDEEPRRQLQKFEYPKDERIYGESQNLYEDYYEEIYEYFHD